MQLRTMAPSCATLMLLVAGHGFFTGCDGESKSSPSGQVGGDTIAFEGDEPGECENGADDDRDLLFDCEDPDCYGSRVCRMMALSDGALLDGARPADSGVVQDVGGLTADQGHSLDSTMAVDPDAALDTGIGDVMVMDPNDVRVADARVLDIGASDVWLPDAQPVDARPALDVGAANDVGSPLLADSGLPNANPCPPAAACEGFEMTPVGPVPPRIGQVVSPNCAGDGQVAIDDSVANGGANALRITGSGGYCNHVFLEFPINGDAAQVFVRFYVRFGQPLTNAHVTFLTMHDTVAGRDIRMGGQSEILMWNRESDDATLPELSPNGIAESVRPVPDVWHCIEFELHGANGHLNTWMNDQLIAGLVIDGQATPDIDAQWLRLADWRPRVEHVRFGWESYGNDGAALWFDDIVIGSERIGCLP